MATHSSILAWRIPWTEDSGGLLSMGLHRGRHDWSDLACMHALEKEMATHSSIPAWRIPGTEEPHGLLSVGSHRVRHDWSDLAAAAAISEGREVLRHFGMTASLGTKKTKPQLTGTHWHQIKRGKKKKKKKDTKSTYNIINLCVSKPWFFGCWRMPLTPSRRPKGRRGWLSTAQPHRATWPQTHGWLWSRCQGARRWWR